MVNDTELMRHASSISTVYTQRDTQGILKLRILDPQEAITILQSSERHCLSFVFAFLLSFELS